MPSCNARWPMPHNEEAEPMSEHTFTLNVNGHEHRVSTEARKTLADVIREDCGLTGTHLGCEHGVCGACTVLVDDEPVRACLMFAVQAVGRRVETVEGLSSDGELHPAQRAKTTTVGVQRQRAPLRAP